MPTNEPFYEHLPCALEPQELVLKSKQLAQLLCDQANVELEKKDANAEFKSRLDDIDKRLSALGLEVRTGREHREVPCIERADYAENRVEIIRMDTGEVIRMRPLEKYERQEALQFGARTTDRRDRDTKPDNDNAADEFKEKMQ